MSIDEILPLITPLSRSEKLQLMQILLRLIAVEEGVELNIQDASLSELERQAAV